MAEWQNGNARLNNPRRNQLKSYWEIVRTLTEVEKVKDAKKPLIDLILELSPDIRYAASLIGGQLLSRQRTGYPDSSASESDKYEELIVNPAILQLAKSRGDIDCGGLKYVIIRYANFFEIIMHLNNGHLSVGVSEEGTPLKIVEQLRSLAHDFKLD
jgi:hypothetical protein